MEGAEPPQGCFQLSKELRGEKVVLSRRPFKVWLAQIDSYYALAESRYRSWPPSHAANANSRQAFSSASVRSPALEYLCDSRVRASTTVKTVRLPR